MSYVGYDFSATGPVEVEIYSFDFAKLLGEGETITAAEFGVAVSAGNDAAPASRLIGPCINNGTVVSQKAGPFLAGVTYILSATVQTSAGQTLELNSRVGCVPAR